MKKTLEGMEGSMICSRFVVFALAFAIPGLPGLAVEPGLPSKTAVMTTAARAIGTYDPDPSVRNPDWLAEHFLGPTERRLLDGTPWLNGLAQDYRELSRIPEVEPVVRYLLVRTKFIDERLIRAVEGGATQVIVLGAGFDSRAYRLREVLKGVRFIEVDFGPTQEYKKRRVRDVLGCLPENVTYVPIDFTREKLEDVLQRTGYRPDQRSFFIWEGVTFYLPEEAVRGTLRYVSTKSAPGSSIVADFVKKSVIDDIGKGAIDAAPVIMQAVLVQARRAAAFGEPWQFGIPDDHEREFLHNLGLELRELLAPAGAEAVRRYRTRRDGSVMGGVPASDYSVAVLLEAGVR